MRKILTALAAASTLLMGVGGVASSAHAQPVRWWNGQRYCWYGGGWKGPGWYGCGYAWRRGYGWGGGNGWNGWGGGGGVVVHVGPVGVVAAGPGYGHYWGGQRYCWFGNGWHGAGWYHCGYGAWRRGYGWGGGYGWNRW
jgi:hypothetical protein